MSHTVFAPVPATQTLDGTSEILIREQDIRGTLRLARELPVQHLERVVH